MSWLPLGIVHFFAFVQTGLPGQRDLLRHLPALRNSPWVPVAILGGCWLRHTLQSGTRRACSTVFRTRAQKSETAQETRCIFAVLFSCGHRHVKRGTRALRLCCAPCQRGFDDAPPSLPTPSPRVAWIALARPWSTSTRQGSFSSHA